MTEPTETQPVEEQKMHFHMVLAEVIFETKRGGISSHRTQIMTQAVINEFPADRLSQLQNSAAGSVLQSILTNTGVKPDNFKVHEVLFLNFLYCGHMTGQEFFGQGVTAQADLRKVDDTSGTQPVATGETAGGDNVVSMKPN